MNGVYGADCAEESDLRKPLVPYSEEACGFSADLSAALMTDARIRAYPDILSFAYWCRRANITRLAEEYRARENAVARGADAGARSDTEARSVAADRSRIGRGLAFHIAPANVPVNFAFSYIFSMLAGNGNIVRAPSGRFLQTDIICGVMSDVLKKHPEIAARTMIVRYPADDAVTAAFCAVADARVIWGGDGTCAKIRAMPCRPRCIDVVFPDRYSFAILDGDAVGRAPDGEMTSLARAFYNDTFLTDQNACSSPRIVFWTASTTNGQKEKFWSVVASYAEERYNLQAASAVDKFDQSCRDAVGLDTLGEVRRYGNTVYRIILSGADGISGGRLAGNSGYFYEYDISGYDELAGFVNEKFQTAAYYGIEPNELHRAVTERRLRGIDRIVPIGKAMDIGVFWDGYDLIAALSRVIVRAK